MGEETDKAEKLPGHKSELYRVVAPDSFYGYIRPGTIEAIFFTTEIDVIGPISGRKAKDPEQIAEINIKFTPQLAKQFIQFMMGWVVLYEKTHGSIALGGNPSPEDVAILDDIKSKLDDLLKQYKSPAEK